MMGGVKCVGELYLKRLMNEKEIDWILLWGGGRVEGGEGRGKLGVGKDDLIVEENGSRDIWVEDQGVGMMDEVENGKEDYEGLRMGY